MFIGIISDTHDRLDMIDEAVKVLNDGNVDLVLHAGDFVSPFVLPRLFALKAPVIGVFGNNDGDRALLAKRAAERGNFELCREFAVVEAEERRIFLIHGADPELADRFAALGCFDAVVRGHTHHAGIKREGKTLVVNPGEVCGYITGLSSIAVMETNEMEAEIIEL
ncbi:MAG: metallophosphoesterase [Methanomicrobiales archaeon]|nr:metallophosphoesterase [Methanomicrobiales archaeon]